MPSLLHDDMSDSAPASPQIGGTRSASIMNVSSLLGSDKSSAGAAPSSLPQQLAAAPAVVTSSLGGHNVVLPFKLPPHSIDSALHPYNNLAHHLARHNLGRHGKHPDWTQLWTSLPSHRYEETCRTKKLCHDALQVGGGVPSEFKGARRGDIGSITHVLAIAPSQPTFSPCSTHVLLPIHALFYAVQCVNLPSLPPTHDPETTPLNDMVTIPVVGVPVPSPETFGIIHRFLYHHSMPMLLKEMLPMAYLAGSWRKKKVTAEKLLASREAVTLAGYIMSKLPFENIFHHLRLISKAWSNANAIGLWDERFWHALERAYQVAINAYSLKCTRQRKHAWDTGEQERSAPRAAHPSAALASKSQV